MRQLFREFLAKYPLRSLCGIFCDLFCIVLAWYGAWWLRLNLNPSPYRIAICNKALPLVFVVQSIIYFLLGQHKGYWRTASIRDLANIIMVAVTGSLSITLFLFLYNRLLTEVPRSIPIIYFLLYVCFLGGTRFLYRFFSEQSLKNGGDREKVLVVGTDSSTEFLIREFTQKCSAQYALLGLLDKDGRKKGRKILGVDVIGSIEDLDTYLEKFGIDKVFIASSSIKGRDIRRIVESCHKRGIPCRIMPLLRDMISGAGGKSINLLREVRPEDLLGREPISLDRDLIGDFLNNKVILVTGAAGSIGSELCRQIIRYRPKRLVALDAREEAMFFMERSFRESFQDMDFTCCLANVCNRSIMEDVFNKWKPHVVFHAAAYKHVPMVEMNPVMGMKNNLLGTINVAEMANSTGVEKFIFISTDKAVNPTNIMGLSKRLGELFCLSLNCRSKTAFVVTRFGNVLGSSGSVIPIFQQQLESGGPLTVTHPEITRFFMCISEACELVLQASAMGRGGEIFVLEMGEPVKIVELAKSMIRLAGFIPGKDIDIIFTGLRPGEKLYEELFYEQEKLVSTKHKKILLAKSELSVAELDKTLDKVILLLQENKWHEAKELAFSLVKLEGGAQIISSPRIGRLG